MHYVSLYMKGGIFCISSIMHYVSLYMKGGIFCISSIMHYVSLYMKGGTFCISSIMHYVSLYIKGGIFLVSIHGNIEIKYSILLLDIVSCEEGIRRIPIFLKIIIISSSSDEEISGNVLRGLFADLYCSEIAGLRACAHTHPQTRTHAHAHECMHIIILNIRDIKVGLWIKNSIFKYFL